MSQELLTRLWALTLIASAGVLLVLLIRPLLRRAAGAGLAYASWLLVPLLVGLLRPRIVLPADFFTRYDALEQELILVHEAVHLRRHDSAANLLTTLFQTVFWFNPLLHFAARRVRLDQELACDAAVLAQHPNSRSAYAGAILKAALIESSAPMACHWQSRHPLKERILELTRTPPARARRVAARALLSALALGACYTAWATSDSVAPAQPPTAKTADTTMVVPPTTAPSADAGVKTVNQAPEGADLYKVQFNMLMFEQVSEDKTSRRTADFAIAVRAGETGIVKFMEAPDQCTLSLTVTPQPDQMVFVDLPLQCGGEASSPRLLTRLGAKSTIKIGDAAKLTQVSLVVTH